MRKINQLISSLAIVFFMILSSRAMSITVPVRTASHIEVERYLGDWYEILRLSNSFEENCLSVKMNYSFDKRKRLIIQSFCEDKRFPGDEGKVRRTAGIGYVTDKETNAKINVSFTPFFKEFGFFSGEYWILDIDENYQWAMIATPDKKHFWILSRDKTMDSTFLEILLAQASMYGFDVERTRLLPSWPF